MAVAISILLIRTMVGFFPDVTGKKERVHIPFEAVSSELTHRLADLQAGDAGDLVMISDRRHLIANMMRWLRSRQYALVNDELVALETNNISAIRKSGGIIVWDASLQGESIPRYFLEIFPGAIPLEHVRVPYVRSRATFTMGVAIVPRVLHGLSS
jgi:hypothetical protein